MQLELFRTPSQPQRRPPVWERLNQEQRATVVTILARLMRKAIHPQPRRENDEQ